MNAKKLFVMLIVGCALLFSGCADTGTNNTGTPDGDTSGNVVENGDTVEIDYTLMYENETVVETSSEDIAEQNENVEQATEPLEFKVGSRQMIAGVNEGVLGMSEGEQKTLTLPPEEGFGPYKEELVQTMTIEEYQNATNSNTTPEIGKQIMTQMGPITVKDVNETHIVLDANSPFAGKTVVFDITINSIEKSDNTPDTGEIPEGEMPEQ